MKIGWYEPAGLSRALLVKEVGYDYIELALAPMRIEDDVALQVARQAVAASPLPTLAWGSFFPKDLRIVDPGIDVNRLRCYLDRAAAFLHDAGAEVAVMGSAWTRNLPEGGDRAKADGQILQTLDWAADAFKGSGVTVALEPQNHLECNIIRRVSEAVAFAKQLNRPEVRVTADFYHMQMENEALEVLKEQGLWIRHVQLADTERKNPGSGSYPYDAFMRNLKDGAYSGNVSVECMIEMPEAAMRDSLTYLREKVSIFN